MTDFSKLSCTDLSAFINAEVCHIEARTNLPHDNTHLSNIRDAVDQLTKLALLGKFTAHGGYRQFVEEGGLKPYSKLTPTER